MKLTLGDIFGMCSPYYGQSLIKLSNIPLPIKSAVKVSRMNKVLMTEYASVESERNRLVQKYGEQIENGEMLVPEENALSFKEEFMALLEREIDIDVDLIDIDDLGKDAELSAQDVMYLEKILLLEE